MSISAEVVHIIRNRESKKEFMQNIEYAKFQILNGDTLSNELKLYFISVQSKKMLNDLKTEVGESKDGTKISLFARFEHDLNLKVNP